MNGDFHLILNLDDLDTELNKKRLKQTAYSDV